MQQRRLGSSGLSVSALGLGCMGMSEFYGTSDEAESISTLHRALDLGVTFLDTADIYGMGRNESLVGKALQGKRDGVTLATKFGIVRDEQGNRKGLNGKPEYVRASCEASLKRLGVEVIDLYYQHRYDDATPIEDTVGAMAQLVQEGKVRFLGLSEAPAPIIRRAQAVHPITALQSEYSLWSRDIEGAILEACRELDIAIVPFSPLGRGFLTGQIKSPDDFAPDDFRRSIPRFQGENFAKNLELVDKIKAIAAQKSCTPAQLALAWVLAQGGDMIPIPGTRRVRNLEDNLGALNVTLTPDDLAEIERVMPKDSAAGTRLSALMTKELMK